MAATEGRATERRATEHDRDPAPRTRLSRRHLLTGGAAAAAGAALALGTDRLIARAASAGPAQGGAADAAASLVGEATVPFHGHHQAGIATPAQAHASFIAFDLHAETDRERIRRLLSLLTDDARRLTEGTPPLADPEPELAQLPASLTVTFGFGRQLVARVAPHAVPDWLGPLPPFGIDRLDPAWNDGDLVLQICADDPVTVAHATRMLRKDARAFASERWVQQGFRRAAGAEAPGSTMRNLFGQLDGSINPRPGDDLDGIVWSSGPGWLSGGTSLVLRRIAMDLDTWDEVDRPAREASVGRTLDTGAPLSGGSEHDPVDLRAIGRNGLPVIPAFAHARRAQTGDPAERIHRRGYNYEQPDGSAGLLFAAYQADPMRQFVPIQRRLDELDLLNTWTTPIGSAVFAVPPGCGETGFIGETLFAA